MKKARGRLLNVVNVSENREKLVILGGSFKESVRKQKMRFARHTQDESDFSKVRLVEINGSTIRSTIRRVRLVCRARRRPRC